MIENEIRAVVLRVGNDLRILEKNVLDGGALTHTPDARDGKASGLSLQKHALLRSSAHIDPERNRGLSREVI